MPSAVSRRVFNAWFGHRGRLACLGVCLVFDAIFVVLLESHDTGSGFLVLAITRWLLNFFGGCAAFLLGSRTERTAKRCGEYAGPAGAALGGPLLATEDQSSTLSFAEAGSEAEAEVTRLRTFHLGQRRDHVIRDRILDASFLFNTVVAAAIGVKAVTQEYSGDSSVKFMQVAALSCMVFLIHGEFALARDTIWCTTDAEPVLIPEVHQHPVYFIPQMKVHRRCQFCQKNLPDAFRCPMCWNYCCVKCFRSRIIRSRAAQAGYAQKFVAEGQISGDAGPKPMPTSFEVWGLLGHIMRLTREFWRLVLLTLVAVALTQAFAVCRPHFQGKILDDIARGDKSSFPGDVAAFLGVSLAAGLFGGGQNLGVEFIARQLSFTVKKRLFARYMEQDIAFFDAMTTGTLTSRLNSDTNMMLWPTRTILRTLLGNALLLCGGLIMCFFTCWQLTILTFSTISPIADLTKRYARWAAGLNSRISAANAEANTVANEGLSNVRAVKAHAMEQIEVERYAAFLQDALNAGIRDAVGSAATFTLTNYIEYFTGILVLWYGGQLVFDSHGASASVGGLVTFMLYWNQMQAGWKELSNMLNDFTRAVGASQNVLALLDAEPDMSQGVSVQPPNIDTFEWSVAFQNVSFFYWMRSGKIVLHGVSLMVPAGSTCALVGRSGGGKSTLVHLLMRFYDPRPPRDGCNPGTIFIGGIDLRQLPQAWYRRHVGLVAQDTPLFNLTIEENVAYGLAEGSYSAAELRIACEQACAAEFIDQMEEGVQTRVGERGLRLSGGQKQRVALARCFLRRPKFLLLDEATSALDAASEAAVQRGLDLLIDQTAKQVTVVLVAHRLSTVVGADKIAVVNEGRIVEEGTHLELLELGGVYARLVQAQIRRAANELEED